jgi:hypothetical protein
VLVHLEVRRKNSGFIAATLYFFSGGKNSRDRSEQPNHFPADQRAEKEKVGVFSLFENIDCSKT